MCIRDSAVRRPQLWLLDEPHSGLDQEGRESVDLFINEAVKAGATVVIASHELDRINSLSPCVISITGGVAADGENQ